MFSAVAAARMDALGPRSYSRRPRTAGGTPRLKRQDWCGLAAGSGAGQRSGKPAPPAETPNAIYQEDNELPRQHEEHATNGVAAANAAAQMDALGPRSPGADQRFAGGTPDWRPTVAPGSDRSGPPRHPQARRPPRNGGTPG
ncbi:MAG: hypothetical protein ACLQU1_04775 [Bryobacteraceae bacterium]